MCPSSYANLVVDSKDGDGSRPPMRANGLLDQCAM